MNFIEEFVFENTTVKFDVIYEGDEILVKAKAIITFLGLQNTSNITKKLDAEEKCIREIPTSSGVQDCIMLTEMGLYRLLMRSNKPSARPFQKWVCTVIKRIRKEGVYNLQQELSSLKSEVSLFEHYQNNVEHNEHLTILNVHRNTPLVYIGKIRKQDGMTLIKIGSSRDVESRHPQLERDYGTVMMRTVFPCDQHAEFEKFLHNHVNIKPMQYLDEIIPGKSSREVYLCNDVQFEKIINIAKRNVKSFAVGLQGAKEIREAAVLPPETRNINLVLPNLTISNAVVHTDDGVVLLKNGTKTRQDNVQKAINILNNLKASPFQQMCSLAMLAGLSTLEILTGTFTKTGANSGVVTSVNYASQKKCDSSNDFTCLVPFDSILEAQLRIKKAKPSTGMTNTEINLRYSSSINNHAKKFIASSTGTFQDIREMYRDTVQLHRPILVRDVTEHRKRKRERDSV